MNLKNLTFKTRTTSTASVFILKRPSSNYFPVCNIPFYTDNYAQEIDTCDSRLNKFNNKTKDKFNFIKAVLTKDRYNTKEEFAANLPHIQRAFDAYMVHNINSNNSFTYELSPRKDIFSKMFNNTSKMFNNTLIRTNISAYRQQNVCTEYKSLYYNVGFGYIFISKGFVCLSKNSTKEVIPLIMLVIKDDYIDQYKVATLLDLPIDTSKFEFWINSNFDSVIGNDRCYKWLSGAILSKLENPDKIKVVIKNNMSKYYSSTKIPTLKSISEQLEWVNSVKNDWINTTYKPAELLPVKEFVIDKVEITDSSPVLFRSKNLNKFIKESNSPTVYDKYTLIE